MAEALHPTCIDVTRADQAPRSSWVCGPDCPRPAGPDPERDKRIEIYRDRERRRAARALDRYLEDYYLSVAPATDASVRVAGERFVEAVGDYVLARLGEHGACPLDGSTTCFQPVKHGFTGHPESEVHQKAHYGVPHQHAGVCGFPGEHDAHPWHDGLCPGRPAAPDHSATPALADQPCTTDGSECPNHFGIVHNTVNPIDYGPNPWQPGTGFFEPGRVPDLVGEDAEQPCRCPETGGANCPRHGADV